MANITEILGTDSVSSSRPVINSNFELLNDETASITALVDPTTSNISGINTISADTLELTSAASISLSGATFTADATFNGSLSIGGKLIKNGSVGSSSVPTVDNTPTVITKSTYFINSAFILPGADEGQEVTIINAGAIDVSITADAVAGASLGVTSIELQGALSNTSITLRCFNNTWFVIASYGATIA
jgi:hypothetical protein